MEKEKLPEEVQGLLTTIKNLKVEVQGLLTKKAEIVNDINKPIYEAKEKADKLLSEAETKSKELIGSANAYKEREIDAINKQSESARDAVVAAERRIAEAKTAKDTLDKSIVDFNASKFASESNTKSQKREADEALGKAIKLQADLSTFKITLDTRESTLNKKGDEVKLTIDKLEKSAIASQTKIDELRIQEKSTIDQKTELLCIKEDNKEILNKAQKEREDGIKDKKENEVLLEKIKKEKEGLEKERKDNANILNSIAGEREDLVEKEKSLREKERLNKLLERQVNEKIATLKKLREEK